MKLSILAVMVLMISFDVSSQPDLTSLRRADSLSMNSKHNEAISIYSKMLAKNPKHAGARQGRAHAYSAIGKRQLAETDFKEALKLDASCIKCVLGLAKLYLDQDKISIGLPFAEKAILLSPNDPDAFIMRGKFRLRAENYQESEADFNKAISLDSSNGLYFFFRGDMYGIQKDFDRAVRDFTIAINKNPAHAVSYYSRGIIFASQQKWDAATVDLENAIKYDSSNSNFYEALAGVYMYRNEPAKAHKLYSKAILHDKENLDALHYRASASYRLENMEGYCTDLHTLLSVIPPNTTVETQKILRASAIEGISDHCDSTKASYYYHRGIAAYNLRQYYKAEEWYIRGLKKFNQNYFLTNFRGNARIAQGNYAEAEADYTLAITLKANLEQETAQSGIMANASAMDRQLYMNTVLAETYRFRAEARLAMQNIAGARVDIDEALQLLPPNTGTDHLFLNTKGLVYLAENDNSNALNCFNKAVQSNPGYGPSYINRALVKTNLAYRTRIIESTIKAFNTRIVLPASSTVTINTGNLEAALSDCNKAISIDPGNGYAYYVRAMIKTGLKQPDHCYDLLKAEQLGYTAVTELILEYKCR